MLPSAELMVVNLATRAARAAGPDGFDAATLNEVLRMASLDTVVTGGRPPQMLAGQLSKQSTPSRLGAGRRPEEHCA
ncbi:hypothetical protein TgHK011_007611 [Trichoderma gracile]|nr:hypothetical protein TgHK011_007611 [Trichoderma gracile]